VWTPVEQLAGQLDLLGERRHAWLLEDESDRRPQSPGAA
jgi:hypothetical protein